MTTPVLSPRARVAVLSVAIGGFLFDGEEHTAFDPIKGDVDIAGRRGVLTIEVFYSSGSTSQRPILFPADK